MLSMSCVIIIQQSDSSTTYSYALQTCGTFAKGWLTWGRHLDKIFEDDPTKSNNGEYRSRVGWCSDT